MSVSPEQAGLALILIGILLLVGKLVRSVTPVLQRIFLPTSIIAGALALLLGPEVLGRVAGFGNGLFPEPVLDVWRTLPGLLINVVFASLFLGKTIPGIRHIWMVAGPQVAFGQSVAWGQYTFGILLAVLVLTPVFGISPMAGALIEIGFEGGHGTSAGLADTFEQVGFAEGTDLALGLATVGVVSGVLIGVAVINWGVRTERTELLKRPAELSTRELMGIPSRSERESAGQQTTISSSIDALSLTMAVIGLAILVGWVLLEGLILLEAWTWGARFDTEFMTYVPLFPLAMIGGLIVQLLFDRFDRFGLIDRGLILRVQGWSLDFLIVAALATLSLTVIGEHFGPFILLAVVGIGWNLAAFIFLARRMIPSYWFERGVGDLGQSLGMTATGLLLIRIADSENKSPALEAFGYKQLLFEPVVGGGLFTALSVPLIFQFGPIPILLLTSALMLAWIALGLLYFGKQ